MIKIITTTTITTMSDSKCLDVTNMSDPSLLGSNNNNKNNNNSNNNNSNNNNNDVRPNVFGSDKHV
jgi:hypothetical protein